MRSFQRWLLLLLACHFALVVLGALQISLSSPGIVGRSLRGYSAATGAASSFSFFAPSVGSQLRTTFELVDERGDRYEEPISENGNREIVLRLNKIISVFWDEVTDERMRRGLSASLAAKVLDDHPDAKSIALRLDAFALPTMAQYVTGERPRWDLFYRARFVREGEK